MSEAHETAVGRALSHAFYEVVPLKYSTYCSLASRVAVAVFAKFGVPANLVPCQLWLTSRETNHVIGFTHCQQDQRWDGHVVCMTETLLFDGAINSFRRDFDLDVPAAALTGRLAAPSQVLARTDLDEERRLWWFNAPYGFDTTPPLEPVELIHNFSEAIAAHIRPTLEGPSSQRQNAA